MGKWKKENLVAAKVNIKKTGNPATENPAERETFSSGLGFILISAGCAIGLGNVWRFPYVAGQFGGGIFVLLYLVFLLILGLPIVVMEFSVGRASRKSVALSFQVLEPKGSKWHWQSKLAMAANYLLMMFYTTICGWMLAYFFKMLRGDFTGGNAAYISQEFTALTANPWLSGFWTFVVIALGMLICSGGLRRGVEKITKLMMLALLGVIIVLVIKALTLPGAGAGLRFFLLPDFAKTFEQGFVQVIFAAMTQAFFTLSVGVGSLAIFGSYINKEVSLTGQSLQITLLDTFVAIMAGLIIFPACFSFGVSPASGPHLVFITLPNVFNAMAGGRFWGSIFFLFMSFAALSTVVAVFENIISFAMDLKNWSRRKAVLINFFAICILALPCVLGFNVLSDIQPLGAGSTILDFEDFLVSGNLLPFGALIYLLFCVSRYGWGWDNFIAEANTGQGLKFPKGFRFYLTYVMPFIIILILIWGYLERFGVV